LTSHVANVCHGTALTLERGAAGEVYFLSDGPPVRFREFATALLTAAGAPVPEADVPGWLVALAARLPGGASPISFQEFATLGVEVTLDIAKARRDLGYAPVLTREDGLAELAGRYPA
jgi:nucleoside-diphosphate-sugar epimerase